VATVAEITTLLSEQDVPPDVAEELIEGLPGTLVLDEPAEVLAADLALCHPAPGPAEVRVRLRPLDGGEAQRITVVARDRPGLLAASAGALAGMGLSVVAVGAATWERQALALQGITVVDPRHRPWEPHDWEKVRAEVDAVIRGAHRPAIRYRRRGPVKVVASPVLDGHTLVTYEAPDRVGLLWAITSWLSSGGYNVLAARLRDVRPGVAGGTLVVDRQPDVNALVRHLAGRRGGSLLARRRDGRPR
jgi:UTP:GlnB (protein PII) uridylyltransferase